jgi:hypothetical protein
VKDIEDVTQEVKDKNPIELVIAEDGFKLPGHGNMHVKSPGQGGLVVNIAMQLYYWNSKAEHGDVITWVMNRKGWDFNTAVEFLCRRAGMPEPEWKPEDPEVRKAAQTKAAVLDVATEVFHGWLMKSKPALEFVKQRGWTISSGKDEDGELDPSAATAELARLGFSGEGKPEERQELEGQLVGRAGIDPMNPEPAAVAVLGMSDTQRIKKWCHNRGFMPNEKWIENGYIPGMLGRKRLVYPHIQGGRTRYLSGRSIEEKFHFNPPAELLGERKVYLNHVFRAKGDQVVVVEGQGDAVSLGQLGIEAVALNGVAMNDNLIDLLAEHAVKYVGFDNDGTGIANAMRLAELIGPLTRMVNWNFWNLTWANSDGDDLPVKDANDLLRALQ